MSDLPRYLARLAYNSQDWWRPAGASEVSESGKAFRKEQGFGHEDWLFRNEWLIDGWRYGFVQGVNSSSKRLLREDVPFELRLFTFDPQGKRRHVAVIGEVECLEEKDAIAAVDIYKRLGWFAQMQKEVGEAGGAPESLDRTNFAPHVLNIRFRLDRVSFAGRGELITEDDPAYRIKRYTLCAMTETQTDSLRVWRGRAGKAEAPTGISGVRVIGAREVIYSPEHARMQQRLLDKLRADYPDANVLCEEDFVDVTLRTRDETWLFEIKSDLNPLSVVRQALGQLLEYAYHPRRGSESVTRLIIVGRRPLAGEDLAYFEKLRDQFALPIDYMPLLT